MGLKNGFENGVSAPPASRPVYTPDQLDQYFARIRLPAKYLKSTIATSHSIATASNEDAYTFLAALIKYQLCNVPFENLALHYSNHHSIFLSPSAIFRKVVTNHRGGYCMETTSLFRTVLASLGYDVMSTGARVNVAIQPTCASSLYTGPVYDAWNHMVLILTLGHQKYLVDVGFGNNCPTFPVPLYTDTQTAAALPPDPEGFMAVNVHPSLHMRLRQEHIPDTTHRLPENRLWVYSVRHSLDPSSPWIPGYCFNPTVEFLPVDYETMNFFVSKSPRSWFTYHVVCLKFLMDEDEQIVGDITLFGSDVKERRDGVSTSLAKGEVIASEEERVRILHEVFGVNLAEEEREGINGLVTMI